MIGLQLFRWVLYTGSFRPMLGATRCCKQALWQPKAGQCQSQVLPANFDRVLQEEQEAIEWIWQLMSTDGLYEWHSSLPCSVSECMLSLCRPAYLQSRPPRKKSPLSSSVRRFGAAADMDAGREKVSARAVCTAPPTATLIDHTWSAENIFGSPINSAVWCTSQASLYEALPAQHGIWTGAGCVAWDPAGSAAALVCLIRLQSMAHLPLQGRMGMRGRPAWRREPSGNTAGRLLAGAGAARGSLLSLLRGGPVLVVLVLRQRQRSQSAPDHLHAACPSAEAQISTMAKHATV